MQHRKDVLKLAGNTGMMLLGDGPFPVYREWLDAHGGILAGNDTGESWKKSGYRKKRWQKLNAKTWGVSLSRRQRRKFLVIPQGKSENNWIPYQGRTAVQLTE